MKIILSIIIGCIGFSISPAHVGINYPAGDEEFEAGYIVTISWFIEVDHGDCSWNIYFSYDNGSTWSSVAENLSKSQLEYIWTVPDIQTSQAKIKIIQNNYAGIDYETESGNFTISGVISAVPEEIKPGHYILYPAYPNPFNSSTTISFVIPHDNHVEISIYNIAGEKITVILDQNMPAGFHSLDWNADALASGVYLYSIKTGNFSQTRKLILMR